MTDQLAGEEFVGKMCRIDKEIVTNIWMQLGTLSVDPDGSESFLVFSLQNLVYFDVFDVQVYRYKTDILWNGNVWSLLSNEEQVLELL